MALESGQFREYNISYVGDGWRNKSFLVLVHIDKM